MEVTEVRIFLKNDPTSKLKAYATLTFDDVFVVRNVKVIEGNKGLFIAMPSRKVRRPCPRCKFKNEIRSRYCNDCGTKLGFTDVDISQGRAEQSEHRDIAHPITVECRDYIEKKVLEAYERDRPAQPSLRKETQSSQPNIDEIP